MSELALVESSLDERLWRVGPFGSEELLPVESEPLSAEVELVFPEPELLPEEPEVLLVEPELLLPEVELVFGEPDVLVVGLEELGAVPLLVVESSLDERLCSVGRSGSEVSAGWVVGGFDPEDAAGVLLGALVLELEVSPSLRWRVGRLSSLDSDFSARPFERAGSCFEALSLGGGGGAASG